MAVVEPDLEHRVGKRFDDLTLERDPFLFGFVGQQSSLRTMKPGSMLVIGTRRPGRGRSAGATGRGSKIAQPAYVHKAELGSPEAINT